MRAGAVYRDSELVAKVYGPVEEEYKYLGRGLVLLSFLSLPVNHKLMRTLLREAVYGLRDGIHQGQSRKIAHLDPDE